MSHLLEVVDLHVEIPLPHNTIHAVRGFNLVADLGDTIGLVGESGSGKSLTLRAILGVLPRPARISAGRIIVNGVDVTALPVRRRQAVLTSAMSMVFQDSLTALNPVMRVGDQIAEVPRRRLRMSRKAAKARALNLMDRVGIVDAERRYRGYPHEMSGGMRQRICIAIALSAEPKLILADEPTTALDVTIQAQVLAVLADLRRDFGLGMVLVSHDLAVVSNSCDHLNVMYGGRVVESGTTASLLASPSHPYTFALLRSVPDPDEPVHRLQSISGQPPDLAVELAGCSFEARCPFSTGVCSAALPPLVAVGLSHDGTARQSACVHHGGAAHWAGEWIDKIAFPIRDRLPTSSAVTS